MFLSWVLNEHSIQERYLSGVLIACIWPAPIKIGEKSVEKKSVEKKKYVLLILLLILIAAFSE